MAGIGFELKKIYRKESEGKIQRIHAALHLCGESLCGDREGGGDGAV